MFHSLAFLLKKPCVRPAINKPLLLIFAVFFGFACQISHAKPAKKIEIQSDESLGFYVGSRAETLGDVKRIGIEPPLLPAQLEEREDLKKALVDLVSKKLSEGGYTVVPPSVATEIRNKFLNKMGGIYDPDTGQLKQEQAQAVQMAASREFFDTARLDARLLVNIVMREAKFYDADAVWDYVTECSLGHMPPSAVAKFFLGSTGITGVLSGYSVLVRLYNSQGKMIFGRYGGIQLASYYDPNSRKGFTGFLIVPKDQALRDAKRLERGVAIATLPLLQTAEQMAKNARDKNLNPELIKAHMLDMPPLGVSNVDKTSFIVPRATIIESTKKILLMPVQTVKIQVSEETKERYLKLIETELTGLNRVVQRGPNVADAMRQDLRTTKGLFDPNTGKYDEERVGSIRKKAITALNITPDTKLIYPVIEGTRAEYKNGIARWDGVNQNVFTLEPEKKRSFFDSTHASGEGSIRASSLTILLRDSEDKLLYSDQGGIEILEQMENQKAVTRAPSELFIDQSRELPAVRKALRALLKTEEEIKEEENPGKKKKKEKRTRNTD
ncbi:MAG: hypothetical protein RL497_613 [Pseudomonadota bacterium]|jgi:hypothetical protein